MIDLEAIASDSGLEDPNEVCWSDTIVLLHERGVDLYWLLNFVRAVNDQLRSMEREYLEQERASLIVDNIPAPEPLPFAFNEEITPRFLVQNLIVPLTKVFAGPLYARLPIECRGSPSRFVSHTWDTSLLSGPFSTLAALRGAGYVWIDIVCYNQHRAESIATDMKAVVESIGELHIPLIGIAPFERLWCLWELLCAHTVNAKVKIVEPEVTQYDLGMMMRYFREKFKSVEIAATTLPEDREQILAAIVSEFGSTRRADEYIRRLVEGTLSKESDKPWIKDDRQPS